MNIKITFNCFLVSTKTQIIKLKTNKLYITSESTKIFIVVLAKMNKGKLNRTKLLYQIRINNNFPFLGDVMHKFDFN